MTLCVMPATAQQFKSKEDSICMTNRFLYQESYKNKQYLDAYEPWKIALEICPKSTKNLYIQGANIMKAKIKAAKDDTERNALIDELMAMYDKRIDNYGEAGKVKAIKAFDLEQLRGNAAIKEVYQLYYDAMNIDGKNLQLAYIERFFDVTVRYVTLGNADTTLIVDNYDITSDALDALNAEEQDSAKKAEIHNVVAVVENRFAPFASCDELVKIYTKKFEANKSDITLLKKITTILRKKKCMNTELFFAATEQLHSLEPSASTAYLMAQMCYQKDKFSEAAKYVNDALKEAEDKDKYNMYILQGLCYANANSYSAARSSYNKAMEMEPSKGEPYRLMAQLYAKGARSIDDGLGGRTAYWAAVDAARRAISIDASPENVEAAQSLINSYSGHFPKQSDAFMLDLIDGSSYTVPGWIGVSTTVRTRK